MRRAAMARDRRRLESVGRVYDGIDEHQRAWIARQPLFFVGTAPLAADGHVNVSPKGPIGSLRVLDDHTVAYLDVGGSGAETIAHVRENGRIVVMLCAFSGPPRVLRLHGTGTVHLPGEGEYEALLGQCAFDEPSVPAYDLSGAPIRATMASTGWPTTVWSSFARR